MKTSFLTVLFLSVFFLGDLYSLDFSNPEKNYLRLSKLYNRWDYSPYGGRKGARIELYSFLVDLIYNEIETEFDFSLVSPEGIFEKKIFTNIRGRSWLKIHGKLDESSVEKIIGKDFMFLRRWWREKKLCSIKGKVKKFRLGIDKSGRVVHLYLDRIEMKYEYNTRRNSRKKK